MSQICVEMVSLDSGIRLIFLASFPQVMLAMSVAADFTGSQEWCAISFALQSAKQCDKKPEWLVAQNIQKTLLAVVSSHFICCLYLSKKLQSLPKEVLCVASRCPL
jgi:hypothetical protein